MGNAAHEMASYEANEASVQPAANRRRRTPNKMPLTGAAQNEEQAAAVQNADLDSVAVRFLDGRLLELQIAPGRPVAHLKAAVAQQLGLGPFQEVRLFLGARELEDNEPAVEDDAPQGEIQALISKSVERIVQTIVDGLEVPSLSLEDAADALATIEDLEEAPCEELLEALESYAVRNAELRRGNDDAHVDESVAAIGWAFGRSCEGPMQYVPRLLKLLNYEDTWCDDALVAAALAEVCERCGDEFELFFRQQLRTDALRYLLSVFRAPSATLPLQLPAVVQVLGLYGLLHDDSVLSQLMLFYGPDGARASGISKPTEEWRRTVTAASEARRRIREREGAKLPAAWPRGGDASILSRLGF